MAKNWSAYEAAVALYGTNKDEISEIGSRYPLFTRTVSMMNSDYLLDIMKAIPKVTARVVETGLKDGAEPEEVKAANDEPKEETKKVAKATTKSKKAEPEEDTEDDYESMTSKALYKLCCDRGISSQCKKRDKASLIAVLRANEDTQPEEVDDWDDEEEEETDPYAGKTAKELYKMCQERGIKAKQKLSADAYAKLLKKADEAEVEQPEDEDEDDDDWEI